MSYRRNLGKVKGEPGQVVQPKIETENGTKKIKWEIKEQSELVVPPEIDITPTFYKPIIDIDEENGKVFISFESVTSANPPHIDTKINIKGDKGDEGTFDTVVCPNGFPTIDEAEEGRIYIYQGEAKAYDAKSNKLYFIEDLGKFNAYLTIRDADSREEDLIANFNAKIGQVADCQRAIMQKLGVTMNIPNGD